MGEDKALIRLLPGDRPLLGEVIARVGALSDDLFIVASGRPEYAIFQVPVLPDLFPNCGALGGIASAVTYAQHDRCLVVSCDHPFLNLDLLRSMIEMAGEWDSLIPTTVGESRQAQGTIRQTLHAIYKKSCLPAMLESLSQGELRTTGFLSQIRAVELSPESVQSLDPSLMSFFSVNTPAAVDTARKWKQREIEIGQEFVKRGE